MRYLIKIDELKEKTKYLEQQIDNIREYVDNLDKARNDVVWEGEGKILFMSKYDNYVEELKEILKRQVNVLLYLKSYYSNYNEEYLATKKKYDSLLNEVDNNGIC